LDSGVRVWMKSSRSLHFFLKANAEEVVRENYCDCKDTSSQSTKQMTLQRGKGTYSFSLFDKGYSTRSPSLLTFELEAQGRRRKGIFYFLSWFFFPAIYPKFLDGVVDLEGSSSVDNEFVCYEACKFFHLRIPPPSSFVSELKLPTLVIVQVKSESLPLHVFVSQAEYARKESCMKCDESEEVNKEVVVETTEPSLYLSLFNPAFMQKKEGDTIPFSLKIRSKRTKTNLHSLTLFFSCFSNFKSKSYSFISLSSLQRKTKLLSIDPSLSSFSFKRLRFLIIFLLFFCNKSKMYP